MADELNTMRAQTIVDMSNSVLASCMDHIKAHGYNDPQSTHIIAAALSMTIERIDKVVDGFRDHMAAMLLFDSK